MAQIEMKPTMYVDIDSHNPIAQAIKATALGTAEPVDLLVNGDAEADIAVTNSIVRALRMFKTTGRTSIVLVYESKDREETQAFASRFPDHISAVPFVGLDENEMSFVPFLPVLIANKTKEV